MRRALQRSGTLAVVLGLSLTGCGEVETDLGPLPVVERLSASGHAMNKADIIDELASKTGIDKTTAGGVILGIFSSKDGEGIIATALVSKQTVDAGGFGEFVVGIQPPGVAKNPQTGATIQIKAKKIPRFIPGDELEKTVGDLGEGGRVPKKPHAGAGGVEEPTTKPGTSTGADTKRLTLAGIATALVKVAEINSDKATQVVNAIFDARPGKGIIAVELDAGNHVEIPGFGTFSTATRGASAGIDPSTGGELSAPAVVYPVFKPAKGLRDRVEK